jgi:hypothetical protein
MVSLETGEPGWGFSRVNAQAVTSGLLGAIPTWQGPPPTGPSPGHPSTVTKIDHVVLRTPSLSIAEEAITSALGMAARRRSSPRRTPMMFFRVGEALLEVVESAPTPTLSGVALRAVDIDAAVAIAGGLLGRPHPAIQGGRLASATRRWDGFSVAVIEKGEPSHPGHPGHPA